MEVTAFYPPAGPRELDFVAWLDEVMAHDSPRVWLLRHEVPLVNVRHISDECSYDSAGTSGTKTVGVSVPRIRPPVDAPLEPPPGYDDSLSALVTWASDLYALASSAAADVATREPELDSVLKLLRDDDSDSRLLVAGRQRLHDAGAWPWAVVGDGWLSFDWWTREEFASALARWAEGPD